MYEGFPGDLQLGPQWASVMDSLWCAQHGTIAKKIYFQNTRKYDLIPLKKYDFCPFKKYVFFFLLKNMIFFLLTNKLFFLLKNMLFFLIKNMILYLLKNMLFYLCPRQIEWSFYINNMAGDIAETLYTNAYKSRGMNFIY